MKVALTQESFDTTKGGAEVVARVHADMLLAAGHETHVFTRHFGDLPAGFKRHKLWVWPWQDKHLGFSQSLRRALRRQGAAFDVVHGYGKSVGMDVLQAGGGLHSRFLEYLRRSEGGGQAALTPEDKIKLAIEKEQFPPGPDGPHYVALSRMVERHILETYDIPAERVHVIYLGVDTRRFSRDAARRLREPSRARLGLASDETALIFMAHNFRLKGLKPLLEALAVLRGRGLRPSLVVVGRGRQGEFRAMAERLGVGGQTRFAGAAARSEEFYAAGDLLVHPSFYDPCATVVFEALGCGLPVVTSVHNGSGEILAGTAAGEVVDPEDVEALAAAIERYLSPQTRAQASAAAFALGAQYTFERYYGEVMKVYDVIRRRKGRG